ncbi:MAG TPA: type II secretion system F family protein, partial [Janthinobacterium sp.]|nr:type II secretion system F family protein [Janthinobacterium sp.]
MPRIIEDNPLLVMVCMVFVAVLLLLSSCYLIWQAYRGPQARKIEKRLQALSGSFDKSGQARLLKQRMLEELPLLDRIVMSLPRAHRLDRLILQSGLDWSVARFLLSSAVLALAGAVLAWSQPATAAAAGPLAAVAAGLPLLYVLRRRRRRLAQLERQLPDAIDLTIRALRAGHAFSSSLQMIGEEMSDPIAGEFRVVHDEINFGVSLQQALSNLSERIPLTDLRFFVVAVMVQRDSGGNLTEVLGKLSRLIRERL